MHRPELGTKRVCQHCGARFYDLGRDPIVCPKCGAEHTAEMFNRMKRSKPGAEAAARSAARRDAEVTTGDSDDAETEIEETAEEEEAEFEDASELGEDEEDMAQVIDNIDEAEPDEDIR